MGFRDQSLYSTADSFFSSLHPSRFQLTDLFSVHHNFLQTASTFVEKIFGIFEKNKISAAEMKFFPLSSECFIIVMEFRGKVQDDNCSLPAGCTLVRHYPSVTNGELRQTRRWSSGHQPEIIKTNFNKKNPKTIFSKLIKKLRSKKYYFLPVLNSSK